MKKLNFNMPDLKSLSLPFKLQKRDRLALTAAAVAVAFFLLLQFGVFPIMEKRETLKNEIVAKTEQYKQMLAMQRQIQDLTKISKDTEQLLQQRSQGFTLFSFLDGLAGKNGIKQNITSMKPTTSNLKNSSYSISTVNMKMQSLTMQQVVNFVHGIETAAQQVWIKGLTLTSGDKNENLLNALLIVETYKR